MQIDINKLRQDLKEELYGAAFGGGFGGALVESFDVDRLSDEAVIQRAMANGLDLSNYVEG